MHLQFDFGPSLFFCGVYVGLFFRFRTGLYSIAVPIIPDYGWNLGVSGLVFLSGKPVTDNHVSPRVSIRDVCVQTNGGEERCDGEQASLRVKVKCGGEETCDAHRVTSYIFGISPGSKSA